jgi:hypothetical protein
MNLKDEDLTTLLFWMNDASYTIGYAMAKNNGQLSDARIKYYYGEYAKALAMRNEITDEIKRRFSAANAAHGGI